MNLIPGEHVQDAEGIRQAQEERGEGRRGGASQEEEQDHEAVQAQVLISILQRYQESWVPIQLAKKTLEKLLEKPLEIQI